MILVFMLEQARTKNLRLAVTGLLLYSNRQFMQLIEGEKDTILSLWETIRIDERHIFPRVIYEGLLRERGFANWSMGFQDLAEVNTKELQGFSSFLQKGFTSETVATNPSKAHRLLCTISEVFSKNDNR